MILPQLGIYGWSEPDENLLLASLLTGDPLLLIGRHGCAKTYLAQRIAQTLNFKFVAYDASKSLFEDVLGYPHLEKLKHGCVEYVMSPVTVWDKELVLIDELNRAVPELQSKWLEIIRSRKVMGFPTQVKWVWAAMNPSSYSAVNALDEALAGRFALFLYPPDILQMNEEDRMRVGAHVGPDDAPGLTEWIRENPRRLAPDDTSEAVAEPLRELLCCAAGCFSTLRDAMPTLAEFLARLADLLSRETQGEVALDGRRLGFLYRNLLANRTVELAKAEILGGDLPDFVNSARYTLQAGLPAGLAGTGPQREETLHNVETCFQLLSGYFDPDSDMPRMHLVYELLTCRDPLYKVQLLLTRMLSDFVLSKAWIDVLEDQAHATLFAYVALYVEALRPGTVPQELLTSLSQRIVPGDLSSRSVGALEDDAIEYVEEIEQLLDRDSDLGKLVAHRRVRELVASEMITLETVRHTEQLIEEDLRALEKLLKSPDAAEGDTS